MVQADPLHLSAEVRSSVRSEKSTPMLVWGYRTLLKTFHFAAVVGQDEKLKNEDTR